MQLCAETRVTLVRAWRSWQRSRLPHKCSGFGSHRQFFFPLQKCVHLERWNFFEAVNLCCSTRAAVLLLVAVFPKVSFGNTTLAQAAVVLRFESFALPSQNVRCFVCLVAGIALVHVYFQFCFLLPVSISYNIKSRVQKPQFDWTEISDKSKLR